MLDAEETTEGEREEREDLLTIKRLEMLKSLLMMMSFIVLSETKLFQDQEVTETRAACYAENVTTKCTSARFS
jgi:hypothetical protein